MYSYLYTYNENNSKTEDNMTFTLGLIGGGYRQ